jgi:hypothetical protein
MKLCIYVQDYETALNLHWAIGAILFHLILPYPVPCLTVNCCHYRKQIISETHLLCVFHHDTQQRLLGNILHVKQVFGMRHLLGRTTDPS